MRTLLLAGVVACARPVAAPERSERAVVPTSVPTPPDAAVSTAVRIVAPALGARQLIDDAGVATYLEDHALRPANIDGAAMERWFSKKPRGVFLYTARAIETGDAKVRGRCQWVPRENSAVLNAIEVVVWRRGDERTLVELGQERATVRDEAREQGAWSIRGVRSLPMQAVLWNDAKIQYAEGAEVLEVACVQEVRTMPCGEGVLATQHGSCIDRALVVRPWRAPTVPHVGGVIPAYADVTPDVPAGSCDVTCEPSACEEAQRIQPIPRVPLYTESAPVVAAFRTEAACRAFASVREAPPDAGAW